MMREAVLCLWGVTMAAGAAHDDRITVLRQGQGFLVRSAFSTQQDIIIRSHRSGGNSQPNEEAYLVPTGTPLADYATGERIHAGGDEMPAFPISPYGTLGGNHASPYAQQLTAPDHGLTASAVGTLLTDGAGNRFAIMRVIDPNSLLIHPAGATPGAPVFTRLPPEGRLFRPDGRELHVETASSTQLWPGTRVTADDILVDGHTPLRDDGREIECAFLDHRYAYDVILPESLVAQALRHPGKPGDVRDPALESLFSVETLFRFQPYGACTLDQTYRLHRAMSSFKALGVMFGWAGTITRYPRIECYIPKLRSFTTPPAGPEKVSFDCDFAAIAPLPAAMPANLHLTREHCLDPADPPDRFVRIAGDTARRVGIALGYSLFDGCTAKARLGAERNVVYHLYSSHKMYPYCLTLTDPAPGTERRVLAFRQYFDPQREPDATLFIHHRQADSDVVYIDVHKTLNKKTVTLPRHLAGRPIAILEKTPSLTLHGQDVVPPDAALSLSVTEGYGYVVLKID